MFRNETNYVLTNGVLLDGTDENDAGRRAEIFILRAGASARSPMPRRARGL